MQEIKTKNKFFNRLIQNVQQTNFEARESLKDEFNKYFWEKIPRSDICKDPNLSACLERFEIAYQDVFVSGTATQAEYCQFRNIVYNISTKIDDFKVQNNLKHLDVCQEKLEQLENTTLVTTLKTWFKDFSREICYCLKSLNRRVVELESETSRKNVLLYIVQIGECIRLIFKTFSHEMCNNLLLTESRRYLSKRFIYCLDGLRKALKEDLDVDSSVGFIQCMDYALDVLATIDTNDLSDELLENAKNSIDEVLYHAMSLAQICSEEDCKRIKSGIQVVLHNFNQLQTEIAKPIRNLDSCNLELNVVSDKLCSLERKINIAVLNIALKTFATGEKPLRDLQKLCEDTTQSILSRCEEDLDDTITKLDANVDCLIQIGLFAIACSTNQLLVANIRSCLASFESLETELVPALTSLYMEPSKITHLHSSIFVEHWCNEYENLKKYVCCIIEPIALGQVILDGYKTKLEENKTNLQQKNQHETEAVLKVFKSHVQLLLNVAKTVLPEINLKENPSVMKSYKNLQFVHRKMINTLDLFKTKPEEIAANKIIKMLKICENMIKRLITALTKDDDYKTKTILEASNPESHKSNSDLERKEHMKTLTRKGQDILKNRSILYKTPGKGNRTNLYTPKKLEERKLGTSYIRTNISESVLDKEDDTSSFTKDIAAILDDIEQLEETMS